jgi:hypothetical protein
MKLQIINCLDLLYPYQVMRIVKKTSSCELVYDVKGNYAAASADTVILISDNPVEDELWLKSTGIDEHKVIWFVSEPAAGKVCWVMPKAFEKEFDFEILKENKLISVNLGTENFKIDLINTRKPKK